MRKTFGTALFEIRFAKWVSRPFPWTASPCGWPNSNPRFNRPGSMSGSPLVYCKNEQRGVIKPVASAEFPCHSENLLLQGSCCRNSVFLKQMEQTRFAKFLARGVARFGYAVREQNDAIARSKLRGTRRKRLMRKNAQHPAACFQPLVRTVAMQQNRRIVPRIGIPQKPRRAVELRVKKGNEAVVAGVVADE